MSTKNDLILSIRDLSISFRMDQEWTRVIHGLNLEIQEGKTLGVVGESGSGKTVSSLACMGLLPPQISRIDSGEILFGKEDANLIADPIQHRGKRITMIFQEPMTSLNPSMRVGKQVVESMEIHLGLSADEAKKKTIALFEEVELPDPETTFSKYPHELSGGQKQRIVIAMALAPDPELIIADEPTTALDVTVQESIIQLLNKLKAQRKLSMLFISHDLRLVARVADNVAVMWKGNLVETGKACEVLKSPSEKYTQGLLNCEVPLEGNRIQLPTVQDALEGKPKSSKVFESASSEEWVFRADKLSKRFPTKKNVFGKVLEEFEAVKEASFDLKKGETLGIVGESGCGKSTLSRMIMGLIPPSDGTLTWNKNQGGNSIQLVFQDPYSSLNPRITAGQALVEALRITGGVQSKEQAIKEAKSLLLEVGLDENSFDKYPHSFSGGQRQRLVVARALCTKPEVLILDESVAALDISVQAQVLNLLNSLKESRGLSFIFISHDLNVVRYMSDRLLVMQKGRIVESGNAQEVFENPKDEYTTKLIATVMHS